MAGAGCASVIGQQQSTVQWPAGTRLERASRAGAPASQGACAQRRCKRRRASLCGAGADRPDWNRHTERTTKQHASDTDQSEQQICASGLDRDHLQADQEKEHAIQNIVDHLPKHCQVLASLFRECRLPSFIDSATAAGVMRNHLPWRPSQSVVLQIWLNPTRDSSSENLGSERALSKVGSVLSSMKSGLCSS